LLLLGAALQARVYADSVTTTATFAGGFPQSITSTPTAFSFNFGTQFSTISSACFNSTFQGDLWDPGETYFIGNVGGQINLSPVSSSFASVCLNPANFGSLSGGSGSASYYMDAPGQSVELSNLTITVIGQQVSTVPEPSSVALTLTGILGAAGTFRKKFLGRPHTKKTQEASRKLMK
jgi:hypothetical protein